MTRKGQAPFIIGFLAPAVLLYVVFVVGPLFQAMRYSLYRWSGISAAATAVGLGNYQKIFHDPVFWLTIEHNLIIVFVGGAIVVAIAVGLAHMMASNDFTSRLLRSTVLIPQMISLVVVAILWQFIYNPSFGLLTSGLQAVHLGRFVHTWLGEPSTALWSVLAAFVWYMAGFYAMLFAAGLKTLDKEVSEAAELDGCVGWNRFVKLTWPMLWSIKRVVYVHIAITVANIFVLVQILTNGGPERSTEVMLTYLYQQGFTNSRYGYASALAVIDFIFIMMVSTIILTVTRKNPEGSRR